MQLCLSFLSGERHLTAYKAWWRSLGNFQNPTLQSWSWETSATLRTRGLSARNKVNNLQRKMVSYLWRRLLQQLKNVEEVGNQPTRHNHHHPHPHNPPTPPPPLPHSYTQKSWFWNVILLVYINYDSKLFSEAFMRTAAIVLQNIHAGIIDAQNLLLSHLTKYGHYSFEMIAVIKHQGRMGNYFQLNVKEYIFKFTMERILRRHV